MNNEQLTKLRGWYLWSMQQFDQRRFAIRLQVITLIMIVSLFVLTSCALVSSVIPSSPTQTPASSPVLLFTPTEQTLASSPVPSPTPIQYKCDDGIVSALVWEDADGNGKNNNETPLSGICMNASHDKHDTICDGTTNNEGKWISGFMVGGCGTEEEVNAMMIEQCRSIYITVLPPEEYVITTQATVIGCNASFGLQRVITNTLPASAPD